MISEIINTTWEVIRSKNQNSSIIREKLENGGYTAVLAKNTANGGQIGFLRLFTPHEKSLGPKKQNSRIIREKDRKRRFYRRFGGKYRQWQANRISKIIHTTWESLGPKNKTLA